MGFMGTFETLVDSFEIERHTRSGAWSDKLLTDHLDAAAQATPHKVAIIDSRGAITYRELQALADRCARGLLGLGIGRGDVISLQLPNWIEFAAAHLAATRIGAVTCLITPIHRDREVAFMLDLAEVKLAFIPAVFRGFDYAAMMRRVRRQLPALEQVVSVGVPADGMLNWSDLIAQGRAGVAASADLARLRPDPNQVIEIVFTSGTSGEPK